MSEETPPSGKGGGSFLGGLFGKGLNALGGLARAASRSLLGDVATNGIFGRGSAGTAGSGGVRSPEKPPQAGPVGSAKSEPKSNSLETMFGITHGGQSGQPPGEAPPPADSGPVGPTGMAGGGDQPWKQSPGGLAGFLGHHDRYSGFQSSNVDWSQYDAHDHYLKLGFHNGGAYGYHDVSQQEAASFYSASSKGNWVWDNLRRRGTVFGYRKPYAFIAGDSAGYMPKYYADDEHREQHRQIHPQGHIPGQWLAGKGPYDVGWLTRSAPHPAADQTPSKGRGAKPHPMAPKFKGSKEEAEAMQHKKVPMAHHPDHPMAVRERPQHKALGGEVEQRLGDGGDNEPIAATPGEFVVNKQDAARNRGLLEAINRGEDPRQAIGGKAGGVWPALKRLWAKGSLAASMYASTAGAVPLDAGIDLASLLGDASGRETMHDKTLSMYGKLRRPEFERPDRAFPMEPEHHAAGGFVGGMPDPPHFAGGGMVPPSFPLLRGLLGFGGGLLGSMAATYPSPSASPGTAPPADTAMSGAAAELQTAGKMLSDAARQISEATQAQTGHGPAAGSSLSPWQWVKNGNRGILRDELVKRHEFAARPEAELVEPVKPAGNLMDKAKGFFGKLTGIGDEKALGSTVAGAEGMAAAGGPAAIALVAVAEGGKKLVDVFVGLTKAALDPSAVIGGFLSPYQSQVAAYNPATVERFNLAMENLSASVGRWLEPLFEGARELADEFNGLNTSVGDTMRAFVSDLVPPIRAFASEVGTGFVGVLRDLAADLGPSLREMAPGAKALGELVVTGLKLGAELAMMTLGFADAVAQLQGFGSAIQQATYYLKMMKSVTEGATAGLLMAPRNPVAANNARTFAAQPARFVGVADVGRNLRQSAFSQGVSIPQQQLQVAQQQQRSVDRILAILEGISSGIWRPFSTAWGTS